MLKFLLTPRWLAVHVLALALVLGMVFLGGWQRDRYQDQQDREALLERAPVALRELATPGTPVPDESVDRRVNVDGVYDASSQVFVVGHVRERTMGMWDVVPLRTADGTRVMVVRGWVDEPGTRVSEVPSGPVQITGVLRPWESTKDARLGTDLALPSGQLPYLGLEPAEQAGALDGAAYQGFVLVTDQEPAAEPAPAAVDIDEAAPQSGVGLWQHLSYWAQWWVFAAAVLFFWVSFVRSAHRRRREDPAGTTQAEPQERQDATT